MPLFFSKDADNNCVCPVCRDDLDNAHMVHSVCGHVLHYNCMMQWIRASSNSNNSPSCPVCGDNISALFSYERHTTSDTKTKIIAGLALTVAFALGVLAVVFFLAITACD